MALVKMIRDLPEVKGGKTEGQFPEEAVAELKGRGWKLADKASEKAAEPKEPKVELKPEPEFEPKEPKVEEKVEPKVEEKKEEFKYSKK